MSQAFAYVVIQGAGQHQGVVLGFEHHQVVVRGARSRQILATLSHPYIVRLLDGGVTPELQPYLVMEYIDGAPITTYCGARRLSIADRLQLFQRVCTAVHDAHKHAVVHRDLVQDLARVLAHERRWSLHFAGSLR